jgi:hypothetical protein
LFPLWLAGAQWLGFVFLFDRHNRSIFNYRHKPIANVESTIFERFCFLVRE